MSRELKEARARVAELEAQRDEQIAVARVNLYNAAKQYVKTYDEVGPEIYLDGSSGPVQPVSGLIIDERELEAAAMQLTNLIDEVEADK